MYTRECLRQPLRNGNNHRVARIRVWQLKHSTVGTHGRLTDADTTRCRRHPSGA